MALLWGLGYWLGKKTGVNDVVANAVRSTCTFVNDTSYDVDIVDHDGTRVLKPGKSQGNYLVTGFSLDLVMHIQEKEKTINFPASKFQNRTHKMSIIFSEHLPTIRKQYDVRVLKAFSKWQFAFNHPGGYDAKYSSKVETKSSWKKIKEEGSEFEAKAGGMIKAIELSASFKTHTNLTRTDEYEEAITNSSEIVFKDKCTIWQEIIVVKTDQRAPFDELSVPTNHTVNSEGQPGEGKLFYCK